MDEQKCKLKSGSGCISVKTILDVEKAIIQKHIDEHKWFQQIPDYNDGVVDFVNRYGWLMRELYCGYVCEIRHDCECAKQFLPQKPEQSNAQEG